MRARSWRRRVARSAVARVAADARLAEAVRVLQTCVRVWVARGQAEADKRLKIAKKHLVSLRAMCVSHVRGCQGRRIWRWYRWWRMLRRARLRAKLRCRPRQPCNPCASPWRCAGLQRCSNRSESSCLRGLPLFNGARRPSLRCSVLRWPRGRLVRARSFRVTPAH